MCVKQVQHHNIQIYFCNIRMKHFQYYSKIFETRETFAFNMRQTLTKTEDGEDLDLGYEANPATKKMMTMIAELTFCCLQ